MVDDASGSAERGYLGGAGNLLFTSACCSFCSVWRSAPCSAPVAPAVVMEGWASPTTHPLRRHHRRGWFSDDDLVPFSHRYRLRGAVRDRPGAARRGAAVSDRRGGGGRFGRYSVAAGAGGQPTAAHQRHRRASDRPWLRTKVTIRDGNGDTALTGPVTFLPRGSFTSFGVIKVPDGRPDRLAFEGIVNPTAVAGRGPTSVFPDALLPMLSLNVWSGPPRTESGERENVYSLNRVGLTQLRNPDGSVVAVRLAPGKSSSCRTGRARCWSTAGRDR